MSSRIFQSVIIQMKEATDRTVGVADAEGAVVASSDLYLVGTNIGAVQIMYDNLGERLTRRDGRTFKLLGNPGAIHDYAVFADGEDDMAKTVCVMAAVAISSARYYYEENHDRNAFVKNILSDNILPGEVVARARELQFSVDTKRLVVSLRLAAATDVPLVEFLQSIFQDRQHEFVVSMGETVISVVTEMPPGADMRFIKKLASNIERKVRDEYDIKPIIGVGTPARNLRELADRYKESIVSIEIGKVFETDKTIIYYENLGIGRLIYQLPMKLCEMFLSEVFKKNPIEALDAETLYTINKFFENSLNVSETSRRLFVHRNTLVYRLEKIKKITGLDLREFEQAIVFQVAMMVNKYLNSQAGSEKRI
ncbi:MAG: helix-turn-helix domain-containing protein [Oscillospiraceae bacterium]|nr:helix-turn-helix domain-containing protein [Oscillospiraceae bacterium]